MKEILQNLQQSTAAHSPFHLGEWLIEPEFHRLSNGDVVNRVEPKVMHVLLYLAAHTGRVVSKNELLQEVWPDAFVGEDALIRCISILRRIFRDTPHDPQFIRTVSKVGYCLMVEPVAVQLPVAAAESSVAQTPADEKANAKVLPEDFGQGKKLRPVSQFIFRSRSRLSLLVLVLLVLSSVGGWLIYQNFSDRSDPIWVRELTTNIGEQTSPIFSPDGTKIAFIWIKNGSEHRSIYIRDLKSELLVRLTSRNDDEFSPVWSPDGKQIAFLSASSDGLGLYIAPVDGHAAIRKLFIPGENTDWSSGALSWSPDGKSFVLADHMAKQPTSAIYRIDIATGSVSPLTKPPDGWEGDRCPRFSPDGKKIAFLRASESQVMDLYTIPAEGGTPAQLTHDMHIISGLTWASNSRSIIFSSNRAGMMALWQIAARGGLPRRLPVGTEGASFPAISLQGKLAFVENTALFGVFQIPLGRSGSSAEETPIVRSTAEDSAPSASPDGRFFAFQSWRSGSQQIWISSADGQTVRQLSSEEQGIRGAGSPSWSPTSDQILFDARVQGHSHIFVQPVNGGVPRQLTFGDLNDIVPRWSANGRTVYFRSNRGDRWQLWRLAIDGGEPQPVTDGDGMAPQESPDGKWLYFTRGNEPGLWRMPADGGVPQKIIDQPLEGFWAYFVVTDKGIYFLNQSNGQAEIRYYDLATRAIRPVSRLEYRPPYFSGLSYIAARQSLLISDIRNIGSHISVAEGGLRF